MCGPIVALPARSLAWVQAQPSGQNNRYIKKFKIEIQIHSGSRFNLLIMIGRTRARRARLIPTRNKFGYLIVDIMILLLHLSIPVGIILVETNEAWGEVTTDERVCFWE
jgi:hypothetical protein